MKFSASVLALCAFQASAFQVSQPKARVSTSLNSNYVQGGMQASAVDQRAAAAASVTNGPQVTGNAIRDGMQYTGNIWDTVDPITVQGGSLRTWSFETPQVERVQVLMKTDGRPLSANLELWQGPDNTPQKMRVYVEDGALRPFSAVIETPSSYNAIAIRNTGHLEFPLSAAVEAEMRNQRSTTSLGEITKRIAESSVPRTIQGGALRTYPYAPAVESVIVQLKTDGRPLNARIELLQGPNNNKQVMEVYTEDGMLRPFFVIIETPGIGNVVRVVNTGTVEFPLTCVVEPYLIEPGGDMSVQEPDVGLDSWWLN